MQKRHSRGRTLRCVLGLFAGLLGGAFVTSVAAGGDRPDSAQRANQVLTLQVENDLWFGNTDRDYTNGIRASYVYEPLNRDRETGIDTRVSRFLLSLSPIGTNIGKSGKGHIYYSLGLGQNMYTPDDIEVADIIREDRPYAGWTYLEFGVIAEDGVDFEAWKFDIGLVGPASGAGWTQRRWHELIDSPRPEGWANQLPNEPGVNLHYTRGRRFWLFGKPDEQGAPPAWEWGDVKVPGLQMDAMPHVGASLGNVYTHASAGLTLRVGTNLSRDVGAPPRIQPAMPGSEMYRGEGFDFYVFAGAEGRAVGRNLFLDGTWRSHPHSVQSRDFVADVQIGAVFLLSNWRLAITHAWRTREYEFSDVNQEYGAVTLSMRF